MRNSPPKRTPREWAGLFCCRCMFYHQKKILTGLLGISYLAPQPPVTCVFCKREPAAHSLCREMGWLMLAFCFIYLKCTKWCAAANRTRVLYIPSAPCQPLGQPRAYAYKVLAFILLFLQFVFIFFLLFLFFFLFIFFYFT